MADRPAWATAPAAAEPPEWARSAAAPAPAPEASAKPAKPEKSLLQTILGLQTPIGGIKLGGLVEPALTALTGTVAKPASDVAGLGAMAADVARDKPEGNAGKFQQDIRQGMTYQPQSPQGQLLSQYGPMPLIGKGVNAIGSGLEHIAAPPGASTGRQMLGAGIHEAVNQAPGFVGIKAPPAVGKAMIGEPNAGGFTGRGLMQSALKPSAAGSPAKAGARNAAAVDTMLEKGINVTPGGANKLQGMIDAINAKIDPLIANSKLRVNKQAAADRAKDTLNDFMYQVDSAKDLAAIQQVYDNFMNKDPLTAGRSTIPVPVAQEIKKGTYRQLAGKYGEVGAAESEAQKAIARGLKEEIAKAIPAVRTLNAEESKMLNALPLVEKRLLVSANKNPMGLSILTLNPKKFAAAMADRSELFKSLVARMLYQTGKGVAATGPAAAAGGVATSQNAGQIPTPPASAPQ
jgi:hypothetical protein